MGDVKFVKESVPWTRVQVDPQEPNRIVSTREVHFGLAWGPDSSNKSRSVKDYIGLKVYLRAGTAEYTFDVCGPRGEWINSGEDSEGVRHRSPCYPTVYAAEAAADRWIDDYLTQLRDLVAVHALERTPRPSANSGGASAPAQVPVHAGEIRSLREIVQNELVAWSGKFGLVQGMLDAVAREGRTALPADDSEALLYMIELVHVQNRLLEGMLSADGWEKLEVLKDALPRCSVAAAALAPGRSKYTDQDVAYAEMRQAHALFGTSVIRPERPEMQTAALLSEINSVQDRALVMLLSERHHNQIEEIVRGAWAEFTTTVLDLIRETQDEDYDGEEEVGDAGG